MFRDLGSFLFSKPICKCIDYIKILNVYNTVKKYQKYPQYSTALLNSYLVYDGVSWVSYIQTP